uniref:Uncharacterized protein n=1 Tax=Strigamia maritima TaxID=126957 RepID=T1JJA2_STRMM
MSHHVTLIKDILSNCLGLNRVVFGFFACWCTCSVDVKLRLKSRATLFLEFSKKLMDLNEK